MESLESNTNIYANNPNNFLTLNDEHTVLSILIIR